MHSTRWRPDAVSIVENDQDQIDRHRLHSVNFEAILSRVEKRGRARLPWVVDWDKGKATLGPMEIGFYKLLNGGFSLSTYRRSDGIPDVDRDAEFLEEAIYCIAQALKKQARDGKPEKLRSVLLVVRRGEVTPKQGPRLRSVSTMREGALPEWAETVSAPRSCA